MNDKPNIIFIVVDALRPDRLGCYGSGRNLTPSIDKFASESVVLEDAYCCINCTDSSLTSIFSGLFPVSHGLVNHGKRVKKSDIQELDKRGVKFLPEILKKEGYYTAALDWLGRWHTRGYDYYSGPFPNKERKEAFMNTSFASRKLAYYYEKKIDRGDILTQKAIDIIEEKKDNPLFLFIHYWDTHSPYTPPLNCYREKDKFLSGVFHLVFSPKKIKEVIKYMPKAI
ncbi:MAG: sulfatase-like hydrolase/transferase, partial [Candidatus Aenigmarchaeota archaeon]|nr:sulfatase-like hydrolase/transferase [Candidatus Aenigmarchaeota archaeon]